ncbi:MAG TPA: hotdog fold thioesterase [Bacteroidia bacterium]|nr:hotdog fold thioesterase [Bacteroidia bacterium]QQR95310.1 MAG: hotdog fold thioesterase [Bacteroidota bacterium]MBP7715583.1 hotdog fold thioesterase [Bacteroidia bacterium]MBP8668767.1 hotdog fold thioesterase [Bacteroidia bacterium]HOZ82060.1 hotdog fold thioesterase [Bacteroidia bacterium]
MDQNTLAQKVVNHMMEHDRFSQWLGIKCLVMEPGKSVLQMQIREEMLNGFGLIHGGIAFSLADSALAFASNAYGRLSVALECSISYPAPVHNGDIITATAEELSLTNRIGVYQITITNQNNIKVAFFKGTVYRTSKEYFK